MSFRRLFLSLILSVGASLLFSVPSHAIEIRNVLSDYSRFSPNGDGVQDSVHLRVLLSEPADEVTLRVFGPGGATVAAESVSAPGADTVGLGWDGRGFAGAVLAEGAYRLVVTATGSGQVSAPVGIQVVLDLTPPQVLPSVCISPNPLTPGKPLNFKTAQILFSLAHFDRDSTNGQVDRVIAWVEHAPGPNAERDDTLPLARLENGDTAASCIAVTRGDTTSFRATWTPSDSSTRNDGVHVLHIETLDAAGNRGGGGFWSVDLVLNGPQVKLLAPRDPGVGGITHLRAIPDSIVGLVSDRRGLQSFLLRFDGGAFDTVAASPFSGDTSRWAVRLPEAARHAGPLVVEWRVISVVGYVANERRNFVIDLTPPDSIVLDHPAPAVVHRETFPFSGTAIGTDSLTLTLIRPDGGTFQKQVVVTGGLFQDSVFLEPGLNVITLQGADSAGNVSPVTTISVRFTTAAGLSAPQSFHANDAFLVRADRPVSDFDVRVYRPDGALVRHLTTSRALDASNVNFELAWDLKDENAVGVGRGPYFCVLHVNYQDGGSETRRLAVVVIP